MDGSVIFARLCQCTPALIHPNLHPHRIIAALLLSHFQYIDCWTFLDMSWAGHLPPRNCPFVWGFEPQSNRCFLGPTRVHVPNSILIGSAIFAQLTAESPYTYSRPPVFANVIHGSLGTPKSTPQTASESVQPFLQGWRSQETGGPCWSICDNGPHLCSTAMWFNNNTNICKGTVNQKSQLNQLCWKKLLLDYDAKYNVQCTSEMSEVHV